MSATNRPLFLALLASVAGLSVAQTKLNIGDPAPAFRPAKWLKGTPVTGFEKGHVYVVEFWATWCKPCKAAMPHLSELARKYRGQAEFIGVDSFEPTELPKVADFVKKQGARMDYRVAADVAGARTFPDWMTAAGEAGIPSTFVVGKDGRIAWIGHPDRLDEILSKALDGTLDVSAERARHEASLDPSNAVIIAIGAQDYTKAIALVDAEVARHPENGNFCRIQLYTALSHGPVAKMRKRARADIERTHGDFGIYNWLTLTLGFDGLSPEMYRFGVEIVEEAVKTSDAKLMLFARGSSMAMKAGDAMKAVDLQKHAIEAAEAMPSMSPQRLEELKQDLARYQASAIK